VQRSFETKEGAKRTVIELQVDEIGPALRYATAKVNKVSRSSEASMSVNGPGGGAWVASGVAEPTEPPF
jgi:single-strand DNA-binding protein